MIQGREPITLRDNYKVHINHDTWKRNNDAKRQL